MQKENPCEPYLRSTEVIRIIQSNNETFTSKVLNCIAYSKDSICRNVIANHYLLADDLVQLCREDAFQQAQITLLEEIRKGHFKPTEATCIPYLKSVFRRRFYYELKRELSRVNGLGNVDISSSEEIKDKSPDYQAYRVSKMIAGLNSTDQETYRLRYVEDLKVKEMAPLLEIKAGSVTKRLSRLHDQFRNAWK